MRRLLVVLSTLVVAVSLASPVAAKPSDALRPGAPVYVVMGDSVSYGQGAAEDPALWPASGFVAQLTERLRAELGCLPAASSEARSFCPRLQLLNVARSAEHPVPGQGGVEVGDVLDEQLPVVLSLLADRNGNANPRDDVEVVTLTIGGNDVFDAVLPCLFQQQITGDFRPCLALAAAATAQFAPQLDLVLGALREAAGPETSIVVLTYYNPFDGCTDPQIPPALAPALAQFGAVVTEGTPENPLGGLNDVIRAVAAHHDVEVADAYGELGSGDYADCKHPNLAGHVALTDVFADVLLDGSR